MSTSSPARAWWVPRPSRWERRVLLANLVGQVLIVVTGGAVRLTGSGLGCSTWPECEPGEFTPVLHEATGYYPLVEFGNRTITGVLLVLAVATAWVVLGRRDRARSYRLLGLVPLAGVLFQAVLGGLTVLVDLHPAVVGLHMLVSLALIAASTLLLVRHGEGDGGPQRVVGPAATALSRALVPLAVVLLVLGVVTTGAGPHSGDEEVAYRLALDPVAAARVHSASVWLYTGTLVALLLVLRRSVPAPGHADAAPRRAARTLLLVVLAQGVVGYVQYLTGLPALLVGIHMLGAALLVVAQVHQTTSVRQRAAVRSSAPDAAAPAPAPAR